MIIYTQKHIKAYISTQIKGFTTIVQAIQSNTIQQQ